MVSPYAQLTANGLTARAESWARYWETGASHSCVGSLPADYGPTLRALWSAAFDNLNPGSRVIDIGTGSGVLARLWASHGAASSSGSARFDAIDLVRNPPPWFRALPATMSAKIMFHGGTRAESLPFDDQQFDLAVSQFGFEYANEPEACKELIRVLKADGRIALIVHHTNGAPVRLARTDLAHADWLLASGGLADTLDALLPYLAQSKPLERQAALPNDPAADEIRQRLNRLMQDLVQRAAQPTGDLCHEAGLSVQQIFRTARYDGLAAARATFRSWAGQLEDTRLRAIELIDCARDAAGIDRLAQNLGGQRNMAKPVIVQGALLGWHLCTP